LPYAPTITQLTASDRAISVLFTSSIRPTTERHGRHGRPAR
jgi:hypothetical protein